MSANPFVEAMVVRAQSPTSVRAGDSARVLPDGTIDGFVGGQCAEASVRLYSLRAIESGEPLLLRILPSGVDGETGVEEGAVTVQNPCLSGGAIEIFLRPSLPPARLRVAGTTPIGAALAELAARIGYAVDSGPAEEAHPEAADAAVVVASHGHDEERVLTEALVAGVPYVALVASKVRGAAVRESLDVPEDARARLHTPAGLEIGAETPGEVALAILAEIVALSADDAGVAASNGSFEVARDPMCGMEVAATPASIQVERDGERYYFCSEGCRDGFVAEGATHAAPR